MANTNNDNGGFLDILKGDKALQFSISLDFISISYLLGGALLVGILLIVISKKLIR